MVVRDPVDRARAQWRSLRLRGESRSLARSLQAHCAPTPLALARAAPTATNSYVAAGEYGRVVAGYLQVLAESDCLVLDVTEFARDPADAWQRLFGFLGVDASALPREPGVPWRPVVPRPLPRRPPRSSQTSTSPVNCGRGLETSMQQMRGSCTS